jgi:protein-S-isoprenylcysteine O-methyltransferase Ste14
MLKRAAFLGYGVACYLVFFGTFLYAVGFIGGFGVPTRLDGPASGATGTALAVDAALLGLFAVQHSVMARRWFKERWTRLVPWPVERSTYVLFSSVALIMVFRYWRPLGGTVWSVDDTAARLVLRSLFAFGWGLVLVCTFLINHFDLFGLRQVWLYATRRPYTRLRFATPGPYRLVRHPLYVGWFFAFWATPTMTLSHLLAVATAYIRRYPVRGIHLSTSRLRRREYRRRVPMLRRFGPDGSGSRLTAVANDFVLSPSRPARGT